MQFGFDSNGNVFCAGWLIAEWNVCSDDIVPLDIEIWPSATLFEAGSTLRLTIQGQDAARYPAFGHSELANRGWHTIFTGGPHDSCLSAEQIPGALTGISPPTT
jgi:predicted acyl esterase